MFFRKHETPVTENGNDAPQQPSAKKHWLRKIFKYLSIFLLILFIATGAGAWWICQTESGQTWLVNTANKFLAPQEGKEGLAFRVTSLSGSLPFNFNIGLEAFDSKGLWLSAPENIFTLNWHELPACLHISALKLLNPDIQRIPEIPEASETEAEPSKPMTLKELQAILADANDFLVQKHWWLPEIKLEGIEVRDAVLPPGLLPDKDGKASLSRLAADINLEAALSGGNATAALRAEAGDSAKQMLYISSFSFRKLEFNTQLDINARPEKLESALDLNASILESGLHEKGLPENLLGNEIKLRLHLDADSSAGMGQTARLKLDGPILEAGHVSLTSNGEWQSGDLWKQGQFDGDIRLMLEAIFNPLTEDYIASNPDAPLSMPRKPINLRLLANGALPRADISLNLDAPEVIASGHSLDKIQLTLATRDLDLPLPPEGMDLLQKEHHCDLTLTALVDQSPVRLTTQAFFQSQNIGQANHSVSENQDKPLAWLASLRNLDLAALGVLARGNLAAYLPPGKMPALDGKVELEISNWQSLQKFIPDQLLSGNVKLDLNLDNADARGSEKLDANIFSPQNALLNLTIPEFSMKPKAGGQPVEIRNLRSRIDLADLFHNPKVDLELNSEKIHAAGMNLNAGIKAAGSISGPLNAEINTRGDVNIKLGASWIPGVATLKNCDVSLTLPAAMSPSGKAVPLAVHSNGASTFRYGENGLGVENLDLELKPSGRLKAHGALSREKLAMSISLDNVNFKPWQILAPQIPLGYANLSANLTGTPQHPGGNFDLTLKDVSLPENPLPPFGLKLAGGIANSANGSALNLQLALDPKSLKALGAENSRITARVPLLFGTDGIPNVNMEGPLAATVNWDGALGPIWNLLPMPDKRLNGRVSVNMNASGSIKSPRLQGALSVKKARFEDLLLGVLLTDINLNVDLTERGKNRKLAGPLDNIPGSVKLSLSAGDGRGGTLTVSGDAAIDGSDMDIKAKINHLRPLRRRDIHIDLSGDASVTGGALSPIINGQLIVNQGEVLLNNLEIMGSVTTLPISDAKAKNRSVTVKEEKQEKRGSINFKINMLPRFTVEGRGLTSIWTAHLLVSGSPFDPLITGNISCVKGNFDFLGKNFALTKGIVFFGGGSPSNPLINMELTNETPDLTAHIIVSGPVDKIKLQLTSEPQLPRDEILSRVLFGRSVGDLSRFEALQLAAGVAQLAGFGSGGGLLSSAKKALGVDVLRLGTSASDAAGEPGDMTAGGTTIEMGKYINDMIYMGVQQGLKADSTAFIIEIELTPRTNLEIRTEQNNTWGGLKWKYNY